MRPFFICVCLTAALATGCARESFFGPFFVTDPEVRVPAHPLGNDIKCIALSPIYVPVESALLWWGHQRETATLLKPSAHWSSGRKVSLPDKIAWAGVVIPVIAVVSLPIDLIIGGLLPLGGHIVELGVLPFGKTLEFRRLDGVGASG